MLKKFDEQKMAQWTPVFVKYNNFCLGLFLISIAFAIVIQQLNVGTQFWIKNIVLLNCLAYLPTILWEIKSGYLSALAWLPAGKFGLRLKSISRAHSPTLFWLGIIGQTSVFLGISVAMIFSGFKEH